MIATTIEQSKKLVELGIDTSTADMYYLYDYNIDEYEDDAQIIPQSELEQHFSLLPEDIPSWSLSALLELFNDKAGIEKEYGTWYAYDNTKSYLTKFYNNPIDAAFQMVVWLKENNKT